MNERRARPSATTVDVLVVGGTAGVALFGLFAPAAMGFAAHGRLQLAVPLALAQAGVLWWRRRAPLAVLAATLAVLVAAQALGDVNAASYVGPHVAAYTVGVLGPRVPIAAAGIFAAALTADVVAVGVPVATHGPVLLGWTGALVVAAWGVGRYVAVRRAYLEAVLAHARQLEAEQHERARRAVAEERRRIARELHDQVAHQLGVVSLQTAAARRWLARDPLRAAEALSAAERASRSALETMPSILQALRTTDDDHERSPPPTLDDLATLADDVTRAGLPVRLAITGERRAVPAAVELAAYRVVQEAVTNVIKHARATHVAVAVDFHDDHVGVHVSDDGHGPTQQHSGSNGHGLVGMRERVEMLGGDLTIAQAPHGGFSVLARLPTDERDRTSW